MPQTISMRDAKISLSRLVHELEAGHAKEFIIARHGRPAARLVSLHPPKSDRTRRMCVAKERFTAPDDIDRKGSELACIWGVPALVHGDCKVARGTAGGP